MKFAYRLLNCVPTYCVLTLLAAYYLTTNLILYLNGAVFNDRCDFNFILVRQMEDGFFSFVPLIFFAHYVLLLVVGSTGKYQRALLRPWENRFLLAINDFYETKFPSFLKKICKNFFFHPYFLVYFEIIPFFYALGVTRNEDSAAAPVAAPISSPIAESEPVHFSLAEYSSVYAFLSVFFGAWAQIWAFPIFYFYIFGNLINRIDEAKEERSRLAEFQTQHFEKIETI